MRLGYARQSSFIYIAHFKVKLNQVSFVYIAHIHNKRYLMRLFKLEELQDKETNLHPKFSHENILLHNTIIQNCPKEMNLKCSLPTFSPNRKDRKPTDGVDSPKHTTNWAEETAAHFYSLPADRLPLTWILRNPC